MSNRTSAITLALIAAAVSGVSNFVNKPAVAAAHDAVAFTTVKNAVVALALVGLVLACGRFREIRGLDRRGRLALIVVGLVGGALPFALFFTGLAHTSAVTAALIHKTLFVWVAILALPFLKERLTAWQWAGAAAVFAANLVVGGFQGFRFDSAELMILAATLLWAVENIVAKRVLVSVSALTLAAARMAIGSAVLIPFLAWRGGFAHVATWGTNEWGWVVLTAALLLAYVASWYGALKLAPATLVAALLIPATLVTNSLTAVFVTHQLTVSQLVSALLFIAGTALLVGASRRVAAPAVSAA
ncbi:MAG: DMT family transporter [Patescibacteria group bacterium]|nr:DMT family transporter [Patescibacteria group bacterium]